MIQTRGFNGALNLDDQPYRLPKEDYVDALNITRDAEGEGQDEVVTNVVGNQVVSDILPTGVSKVIGSYADRVRNRIYYFTWNDDGFNRISYYDYNDNTITVLIEDLTDTGNVGILNFDPSYRINHVDIIYRDDEGDLLYWTDGLNPPSKMNVKTAETGGYGAVILRSFIDVAKEPPSAPPYCAYREDNSVKVNNVANKLFKFKTRYVYDDYEKSVTSAQSEIPIPYNYSQQFTISDPRKNAKIEIAVQTGAKNVTKIEILGAESLGTTFSDFYLIQVLDKQELSIADNTYYTFDFFNNQNYNTIPVNESIQPFDYVPLKALTQSLPNGNVLDYGAITENYDLIEGDYSVTVINSNVVNTVSAEYLNQTFVVFCFETEVSGFSATNVVILGQGLSTDTITVFLENNGTPFQITATGGNNAPFLLATLANAAQALGYLSTITGNILQIRKVSPSLANVTIGKNPSVTIGSPTNPNQNSFPVYDWASRYSYGVVYFDEKGRTNSVITNIQSSFETQNYNETLSSGRPPFIPTQQYSINSRPPIWARYFEIVRTKNLSKSNFIYWVSDATYKDNAPNDSGFRYAYISINTLTDYIINNKDVRALGYEFVPGDRIKFIKKYDANGNTTTIYDDKDYEILESIINPKINGEVVNGQVLKIYLPSTFVDFGGAINNNYLIQIYTPAKTFSNQENIYYEFGERYLVGNPGTVNAYHYGGTQNQTSNLSQPALYKFYKGDNYFRYRKMPSAGSAKFSHTSYTGQPQAFPIPTIISNNINNPNFIAQNVTTSSISDINTYPIVITNPSNPPTLTIKGRLKIDTSRQGSLQIIQYSPSLGYNLTPFVAFYYSPNPANQPQTIEFNYTFTPVANYPWIRWWLSPFQGTVLEFELSVQDARVFNQGIIDPNFSDLYESTVNSNGRAWKYIPEAGQTFNPTLIRFGDEYQIGFAVNNTNRFYEENQDIYDRSRGTIKKMFIEGRNQYIYQEFDVGVVTVLTQIVRDTAGNPLSAQSDRLLNKIVYPYIGQFGIGDVPESFAFGKNAKYFVDSNKGVVCRHSLDGITPLSIVYKMNSFFVSKIQGFKNTLNTTIPATGTPTIYGEYDAFTNKYVIAMEAISRNNLTQPAYTIAFLEKDGKNKGFESFLSYHPENISVLNNLLVTFKDGEIWTHNNSTFCNFYGVQYGAYIEPVFNEFQLDKKTYLSIMQSGNTIWYCPSIISQENTYGSTQQLSQLVEARFKRLEGQYHSSILRDINSPGGLINGDTMKGNYIIVKFQKDNASVFCFLNTVTVNFINSPLNSR